MDRFIPSCPSIKLFLVIAMSLMLSCASAPGIRTSEVAELHYGDREKMVVEKLGEGIEVLYFLLDENQYRYRLYTTAYTKDVYALLFMNGELVAVNDEKQDFSECLSIEKSTSWQQCLTDVLSKMRFQDIDLESHDFSPGVDTEQEEEDERDKARGTYAAIAVPLTVAFPWVVATLCVFSCGACLDDPGAGPDDYKDSCYRKLASIQSKAIGMLHSHMDYEEIDNSFRQITRSRNILFDGAWDKETKNNYTVTRYLWDCKGSYTQLNARIGLTNESIRWSWFKLITLNRWGGQADYAGCEGTWSELKKCAEENKNNRRP